MKKRAAAFIACLILMTVFSALGETVDLSQFSDAELRQLRQQIDTELSARTAERTLEGGVLAEGDIGDCHVAILSLTRAKDYQDQPAVIVKYLFVNHGEKEKAFTTEFITKVFQAGVQCDTALIFDAEKYGYDGMSTFRQAKPGAAYECTEAFVLSDFDTPIEIEIGELFSFSDNKEQVILTITVPGA